jgi:cytochrome P450
VSGFPTLQDFDPLSPEFLADPYPAIERARREQPVFFYPPMNFWVLTRTEDLVAAVHDIETFSSRAAGTVPPPDELLDRVPPNIFEGSFIGIDPPRHTISRKHANKAFTRSRIAALEDDIRRFAHELIDGFEPAGHCDLMRDYCYPLSLLVILHLLGLPAEDSPKFRQWTEDMFAVLAPVDANDPDAVTTKPMSAEERHERWERLAEAYEYFTAYVHSRIDDPKDDLVSALVAVKDDDGNPAISVDGVITHMMELVAAGNDTTANLMGHIALFLEDTPEQREELRRNPALWENATEEGLRRRGTAPGLFRITTRDVEIGGVTIPAHSFVWLLYISAGHDEAVFEDPRTFDIHRPNTDKHMSLGLGRHKCMGAPLARLEGRIGLEVLYERLPSLRVVRDQDLAYEPVMTVLTLRNLLVEWEPSKENASNG